MRKKKKSKNLVLPIMGISLFSMLGITVYLNRPNYTPLSIAEVTTPASNCASVAFTDNFTGTTLDPTKWFAYSTTGGTATLNNQLNLIIPASTTNGTSEIASKDKVEIEGDFIQEITLSSLNPIPSSSKAVSFSLGFVSDDWKNWYRLEVYKNGDIQTYATTDSVTTPSTAINAYKDTPIKLKIVRAKSNLTTYYDLGEGYKIHSIVEHIYTGKVWLQLLTLSHSPESPELTTVVKDFSLKCRPPIPTGLTQSCSADGKTATFKWDDNSPSHMYAYALDDTTENNVDDWYKSGTTDVWRGGDYSSNSYTLPVVPGRKYEWWVRTNQGGPFTDQSDAVIKSFVCDPKPIAPLNLRFTCNPDGKSVRLIWDGVADVESYKVRFDDKNGHVTFYDNIKELQYVVNVTPDKMYSFWTHSSKNGLDSNQSTALDFTCKATTTPTPTPKPTVKPTVTPTSTPTIKPSPSPKPAVTIAPSPSSTQSPVRDLSLTNTTPSPSAEPSIATNPVSRFFRWLASLFE